MKNAIIHPDAFDKKYFMAGNYKDYKKIALLWTKKVARRIKQMVKKKTPCVLDVGCAYGYLLVALQNLGCEVRGLEYSRHAITHAEPKVSKMIKKGSILDDHFYQNEFDAVVCFNVLEYIPEAQVGKALSQLADWTNNLIFFTTCFTHSRYSSQKHSPDPLRLTVKTEKEWITLFCKAGADHQTTFYDGGGGDVLVFKKKPCHLKQFSV